ncbi:hypothetical protein EV130_11539 [Rhizobium azibense]|uniref:Uncharacterized protein n=1 Tax=Rhizobium azibense TaxID=1136135 RepID=A0A4R3QE15_9HYPH|nr:hypothetical protein EV130_11539 [Rhizobium azibense]
MPTTMTNGRNDRPFPTGRDIGNSATARLNDQECEGSDENRGPVAGKRDDAQSNEIACFGLYRSLSRAGSLRYGIGRSVDPPPFLAGIMASCRARRGGYCDPRRSLKPAAALSEKRIELQSFIGDGACKNVHLQYLLS